MSTATSTAPRRMERTEPEAISRPIGGVKRLQANTEHERDQRAEELARQIVAARRRDPRTSTGIMLHPGGRVTEYERDGGPHCPSYREWPSAER